MVIVAKYNQCHGPGGKFCGSGGGGGGGGGAKSDLPPWMKPKEGAKPITPTTHSSKDVPNARVELKPLVGKEVKVTYWAEKPGSGGRFRCIRDVKVEGTNITVQHIWVQKPSKEISSAKYGQKQTAVGLVQKYEKRGGSDYTIQGFKNIINKELIEKFNPNHDPSTGRFSNASGGVASAPIQLAPGEIDPALYTDADIEKMSPFISAVIRKEGVTGFNGKIFLQQMEGQKVLSTDYRYDTTGQSSYYEVQLAIHPGLRIMVKESWKSDRQAIANGKMPFNSCGYAKNEEAALTASVMHEVGHMILLDRTMKAGKANWANPNDPSEGTKKWVDTVNAAAKANWRPPSTYSQTNYGEMFAECYTTIALVQTTGSKDIDRAVGEVVLNGK